MANNSCCNEELAEKAGQDKPMKTPVEVYDQKVGKYAPMKKPTSSTETAPDTVMPIRWK